MRSHVRGAAEANKLNLEVEIDSTDQNLVPRIEVFWPFVEGNQANIAAFRDRYHFGVNDLRHAVPFFIATFYRGHVRFELPPRVFCSSFDSPLPDRGRCRHAPWRSFKQHGEHALAQEGLTVSLQRAACRSGDSDFANLPGVEWLRLHLRFLHPPWVCDLPRLHLHDRIHDHVLASRVFESYLIPISPRWKPGLQGHAAT